MIAIDLSKQQGLDANLKVIQKFTGNLCGNNNKLIFFITEKVKETILNFSQGLLKYYNFILD